MKCLKWNSPLALMSFLVLLFVATPRRSLSSDDFQFFGGAIDYWHDSAPDPKPQVARSVTSPSEATNAGDKTKGSPLSGGAFPWHQYLDPKNKEFFKEGDYTPPEPFMEIVRNPTDKNLKMWFAYIDKRNQFSDRLQNRMKEYMAKNSVQFNDAGRNYVKTRLASVPQVQPDAKRFRFRMYFDSHCPHCRRMFATLSELQSKGYFVEARQVDNDSKSIEGLPVPVQRASVGEIKEKDIQSVPLLLVGDLEKKAVYRISGFQTVSSIFQAINSQGGVQ